MNTNNDSYAEMNQLIQRKEQLEAKLGGGLYSEGEKLRKPTISEEEKRCLKKVCERLDQLKKEDDGSQRIV